MNARDDLERLERQLEDVIPRLVPERPFRPSGWRVFWVLYGPWVEALTTLAVLAGIAWWSFRDEFDPLEPPAIVAVDWSVLPLAFLVFLSYQHRRLRRLRRERSELAHGDVLALLRAEVRQRLDHLLLTAVFDAVVVGLALMSWPLLPDPRPVLLVALLCALHLGFTLFVSIPRWRRERRALAPESDEPDEATDEESDEDDDDVSWPRLVVELVVRFAAALFLFTGPLLVLTAVIVAFASDEPRAAWSRAGLVALAWVLLAAWSWLRDEDSDDPDEGAGA